MEPDNPCLEDSKGIIRFEVQFNYRKIHNITRLCLNGNKVAGSLLLTDKYIKNTIDKYFRKIIRFGDYYTIAEAKKNCRRLLFRCNERRANSPDIGTYQSL